MNPLVWSSFLYPCQHEIQFLAPTRLPNLSTQLTQPLTALVSEVKGIPQQELLLCVYRALFKHLWLAYLPLTITLDTKSINFSPSYEPHPLFLLKDFHSYLLLLNSQSKHSIQFCTKLPEIGISEFDLTLKKINKWICYTIFHLIDKNWLFGSAITEDTKNGNPWITHYGLLMRFKSG